MTASTETERKDWLIPAHGRVEGGALDGYHYAFMRLERTGRGDLDVLARVTPPDWPFPREAHLFAAGTELLRRMPGSRVSRVDLMVQARRILVEETCDGG